MSISRIVGFAFLVIGVVVIIVGVSASRSLADSLSTTFTGRLTEGTLWYFIAGGASVLVGLLLAFGVFGRSRS
jgi:hypothetical protein